MSERQPLPKCAWPDCGNECTGTAYEPWEWTCSEHHPPSMTEHVALVGQHVRDLMLVAASDALRKKAEARCADLESRLAEAEKERERLRAALREAMRVIAKEHICDGCSTFHGDHLSDCKYSRALSAPGEDKGGPKDG